MNWYIKYIKYKTKYLKLKNQFGGIPDDPDDLTNSTKKYKPTPEKENNEEVQNFNKLTIENTPIKEFSSRPNPINYKNEPNTINPFVSLLLDQPINSTPFIGTNSNSNSKLITSPKKLEFNDENEIINTEQILTNANNNLYIYFTSGTLLDLKTMENSEFPVDQISLQNLSLSPVKGKKIETSQEPIVRPRRIRVSPERYNSKDYIKNLTPAIKAYVGQLEPENLTHFIKDLDNDQTEIDKIIGAQNDLDPEYTLIENFGKPIECWLADHMRCPCCNQFTLKRYLKDNFAVIDLVCINPDHTFDTGVKFFQVKASSISEPIVPSTGYPYFNLDSKIIHIGSRKVGEPSHIIKVTDDNFIKKILIGYICVYYNNTIFDNNFITINRTKSFIVLPHVTQPNVGIKLFGKIRKLTIDNEDEFYYWYITNKNDPKSIIKFSNKLNSIIKISTELLPNGKIPKNYCTSQDKWIELVNPTNVLLN